MREDRLQDLYGVEKFDFPHHPVPESLNQLLTPSFEQDLGPMLHGPDQDPGLERDLKRNIFGDNGAAWGEIQNWKSGGGDHFRFNQPEVTQFWEQFFYHVIGEAQKREWNLQLSRTDLFHAHLIFDPEAGDLLILFHSQEYPEDLDPFKANAANSQGKGDLFFLSATNL